MPDASSAVDVLAAAVRLLRVDRNPAGALHLLERSAHADSRSEWRWERAALRAEAYLALERTSDALAELDRLPLDVLPRAHERAMIRADLRVLARRWREADEDFSRVLGALAATPSAASRGLHERALWGRATCRLASGDKVGARADLDSYLASYPRGRFATEAARRRRELR